MILIWDHHERFTFDFIVSVIQILIIRGKKHCITYNLNKSSIKTILVNMLLVIIICLNMEHFAMDGHSDIISSAFS